MRVIHKNEKGFTLVELMVVVVIIGILVAIAIPIYGNITANAEEKACFANQRTIEGAASMYYATEGVQAADLAALISEYLTTEPNCPSTDTLTGDYTLAAGVVTPTCSHVYYRTATP